MLQHYIDLAQSPIGAAIVLLLVAIVNQELSNTDKIKPNTIAQALLLGAQKLLSLFQKKQ